MKEIKVNKTTLNNGLRIITSQKNSDIFSLGVGIKVGSLYEDSRNNGISHMIEHMIFKGTATRTTDHISDDIEKLAGDFDIYTTYDHTVLNTDIMSERAEKCLEIVADMLMNSTFPKKEFSLEKNVIMEEIKMAKDDPEDWSYLGLYKSAFPEEWHKYHIAGTLKSVRGLKVEMLRDFYRNYYIPNNTVICIVSSYSHEEIVIMIEKYFGEWKAGNASSLDDNNKIGPSKKVVRHKRGMSQTHVLYGFDIKSLNRREEIALALINKKIGFGANSILFKELRDKKGYAYSVYSDIDFVQRIRMFYIYAGISEENLKECLNIIDRIIDDLKNGKIVIDQEVIGLVKDMFVTDLSISLESSSNMVDYLLDGELNYGNPLEYMEVLSIIDTTAKEDMMSVIKKVFKDPIVHILIPN